MKIESSKFNLFGKNKDNFQREIKQAIGKNIWVKVELFKNSPLVNMMNVSSMFGIHGTCWVRLLAVVDNFYICNICKASESEEGTVEVTKEEIKKILTTKCKISIGTVSLVTPVEMLTTDELFNVVENHSQPEVNDANEDEDIEEIVDDVHNNWPNRQFWENCEDIDEIWNEYLDVPENVINQELQIFPEPSVQAGMGGMFIYDESGEHRFSTIYVDYQEWCEAELEMAADSTSSEEYADRYRDYVLELMDNAEVEEE